MHPVLLIFVFLLFLIWGTNPPPPPPPPGPRWRPVRRWTGAITEEVAE
ncbi:hypothetical protein [Lyngbya sp. PCC 8106]|nr:hypothetical protein [Lyngbya sp. PCC 8106]